MNRNLWSDEPERLPGELGAIFDEPWHLLPAPAGRFEVIRFAARRRRRRRRIVVAGCAAAAVVVLVTGLPTVIRAVVPPAQTVARPSDVSTVETGTPASHPAPATAVGDGLPAGRAVPSGAVSRSVSTAANGVVYVLAETPCPAGHCQALVRTTDDGRSWRALPAPDDAKATEVRFANPRDGWLYGAQLWATHDGAAEARTWKRVDVGATVLDLASDGTTVWAVVADCTTGTDRTCRSGRLLAAAVGSDEFAPVPGVSVPGRVLGAQLSIAGSRGTLLATSASGAVLFVRHDGGWVRRPAPPACPPAPAAVVAPATGAGAALVAVCAVDAGAGSITYVPYRSADDGSTWARTGAGLRVAIGQATVAAASLDRLAVAVGSPDLRGGLWVSQDGGATWTAPSSLPAARTGWAWVGAAGGARYVALPFDPDGSLWVSGNAGRAWTSWDLR